MRVFIGLDLGTSAIKAIAIDGAGRLLAQAGAPYPTATPQPGWAEQEPADWLAAASGALHELTAALPAGAQPEALALSGQLPTLVLLDANGRALRPAIVWYDGRAQAEAAALLGMLSAGEWYQRSGIVLDAHYLAPMVAWVARHEPAVMASKPRICSAKDALLHALCGALATDPSTASGYGVYDPRAGRWDPELCAIAGLDPDALPAPADPWSVAGGLTAAWSHTGLPERLPVLVGAGDALAGVLGCGGAVPGVLAAITGTSTSLVVSVDRPLLDPAHRFLLTPHALPGLWGLEMDLMSTGSALQWLARMLGISHADLHACAAQSPPGARGLLALPYLAGGEQGALWDPHAPAALVGLSLRHEQGDLARALLEGIAFEMRRCLLAWEETGVTIEQIVLSGGPVTPFFAQLVATVLERPVRVPEHGGPSSALGAALLAGLGSGAWDVATAQTLAQRRLTDPRAPLHDEIVQYRTLYERYTRVSAIMREQIGPLAR